MADRVYLDYSATTPVDPKVVDVIQDYFLYKYGNPSSVHYSGRESKAAIELVRERIAQSLNAEPGEVYFTSGGSESDNLSIIGYMFENREKGNHIVTSVAEHHAVWYSCTFLEKQGFEVTYLPVDKNGIVDPSDVKEAIKKNTSLLSFMHVNNEVGAINPLKEIGQIARNSGVVFHTDAVQSYSKIPIDVQKMNIDLLAASAHKFYGPKGTGFLYKRKGFNLQPMIHGGSQEFKLRAGTHNVPCIAGMGRAVEIAFENMDEEEKRIQNLRDIFWDGIKKRMPETVLHGNFDKRLYSNLNVSFPNVDGEALLLNLDLAGVLVSSGSACTSGSVIPSHVLSAMNVEAGLAQSSIRFTLGRYTTGKEIEYVLNILPECINSSKRR